VNPVELITSAKGRIARVAAIRAFAYFMVPALTAIALAAALPAIGIVTWERMGYLLAPSMMDLTRIGLCALAATMLIVGAARAWRAYMHANDFVAAAERIDRRIGAHEQVVTLATLADPAAGDAARERRSPLFPVLWRSVMAVLGSFNPQKEFALEIGGPLKRSSLLSGAIVIALGLAMLASVEPPTAMQKTAIELRRLASKLEENAATPEEHKLAEEIKRVANNLVNPKPPPKEKQKELEEIKTALAEVEKQRQNNQPPSAKAAGSSGSASSGAQSGTGEAQGNGQGKGQSKGEGKGGSGQGPGGQKKGPKKGSTDTVELRNEIAKAEAQVQTDETTPNEGGAKPSPAEKSGKAPGPNPDQPGGNQKNLSEKGNAPMPMPQPGAQAQNKSSGANGEQSKKGGSMGDTHLGEFPKASNYQRFLKPGEKGEALDIRDARYVVFRIPPAVPSNGDGKNVADTDRPKASAGYTNAPLAASSDTAPPDERQMVPPRYRELIR
jgi:hypothetical protein